MLGGNITFLSLAKQPVKYSDIESFWIAIATTHGDISIESVSIGVSDSILESNV